jgi:hypothetical protein
MLLLTSATSKLQLTTSAVGTIHVQMSAVDDVIATGVVSPAVLPNLAPITAAGPTDIGPAPPSGTARTFNGMSIRNADASIANTVTLVHTDGTNAVQIAKAALAAGEQLVLLESGEWVVKDINGYTRSNAASHGAIVKSTVLTSGTTVVLGSTTTKVRVRGKAGGGGGGGCSSVAVATGEGGGGAEGGEAERFFQGVTPGATLTYAIGAAGTAGATTGGNGGTGGNTSITVNGTTVTANGGPGGVGMVSSATVPSVTLGGAAPAVSTNGDYNGSGMAGQNGFAASLTIAYSGRGGGKGGGNSRITQGAGNTALANTGGGGGGSLSLNGGGAVLGGAGSAGFIILDEYN